jgi:hypothetical protein
MENVLQILLRALFVSDLPDVDQTGLAPLFPGWMFAA